MATVPTKGGFLIAKPADATHARPGLGLIGWLLLTAATAAAGGIASMNAGDFYAELARPAWAPPAWLFTPVWSTLYLLMAVAAWLVWRERGFAGARAALILFIIQLAVNGLWSWLFFVWRRGDWALLDVLLLWVLLVATIVAFHRIRTVAAVLLYPYLAWTTFAAALTFAIWRANPALL